MSTISKKTPVLIVAGLLLLGLAGFFFVRWQAVETLRAEIRKNIDSLPEGMKLTVGAVDVPLFGDTVALSDVAARIDGEKGSFTYAVERIEVTGLNPAIFQDNTGVLRAADKVRATGMSFSGQSQELRIHMRIDEHLAEDIHGDVARMRKAYAQVWPEMVSLYTDGLEKLQASPAAMAPLMNRTADLLEAAETLRIGHALLQGMRMEAEEKSGEPLVMVVSADSAEVRNYSLRELGPYSLRNLRVDFKGKPLCTLDLLGLDKAELPSYVEVCRELGKPESWEATSVMLENIEAILSKQNQSLSNLHIRDLRVPDKGDAQAPPLFTLAEAAFSTSRKTDGNQSLLVRFRGASVAREQLAKKEALPESVLHLLPETVIGEGDLDLSLTISEETESFTVALRQLRVMLHELGEASLSLAGEDLSLEDLSSGSVPYTGTLSRAELRATDLKASDLFFALSATLRGQSPEALRAQAVQTLAGIGQGLPEGEFRILADNIRRFLEKSGGTLGIRLQPPAPLPVGDVVKAFPADPGPLGLSSDFTSGK